MEFEWDATKNEANIIKHGLDFADAEALFENDVYAVLARTMARSVGRVSASYGAECWWLFGRIGRQTGEGSSP